MTQRSAKTGSYLICKISVALLFCCLFNHEADAFDSSETAGVDKPNILFIFADDHSYDCIHATGNEEIQTPNLDKLARGSTHFTRAYNMGAWAGPSALPVERC